MSRTCRTANAAALAGFDIAVIAVPTPLRDGVPDLTSVESCARTLGAHLRPGAAVVLESTTYPGTTEELLLPILEKASGLKAGDFEAGFSPERIAPGNRKRWSFDGTPKLVSGIDTASLDTIKGFYDGIFGTTVPVSGPKTAELAKLIENTFQFVNISLVNELAMLAAALGVDVWEAIDAAATKPFGFMRFTPGPGVGGHCLPVDPMFLSWKTWQDIGVPFRFAEPAADVNRHMPDYVVRQLTDALGKRGLVGLLAAEDVPDGDEDPVPDGGERTLLAPVADQAAELGAEGGVLRAGGCRGGIAQDSSSDNCRRVKAGGDRRRDC